MGIPSFARAAVSSSGVGSVDDMVDMWMDNQARVKK
jgi:hypothetical protein